MYHGTWVQKDCEEASQESLRPVVCNVETSYGLIVTMTARSLTDLVKIVRNGGKVSALLLRSSKDLVCMNMWCEKVTGPCVCRLERAIQAIDPTVLKEINLSGNNLTTLPPSLSTMVNLESLDISENDLEERPHILNHLASLHSLNDIVEHSNPYVKKT